MRRAQFRERFLEWSHASSLQIRVSLPDTFDGFRIILTFPFERFGKYIVERTGGVLSMPRSLPVAPYAPV